MLTVPPQMSDGAPPEVGERVNVVIEVSRWSFVKRHPDGRVDFVAPLPTPYNYGSVLGSTAPDGDPFDAVVMGPRMVRGTHICVPVRAIMGFRDGGVMDPKLICSFGPLTDEQRGGVQRFFATYARFKQLVHWLRREAGQTAMLGWMG